MLSVVLVALVTFTAINRYGSTLSALFGRDLVGALGGKATMVAASNQSDPPALGGGPVVPVAGPLPLIGGSSAVGGVPNMQPARTR